ncbi:hypothetical protein [Streptantibioticus silvisoli]|uniref:Uncharacterized protein n=1 Tax=Streptantibioticus silvisoli TaxID=2705255 RepID=A0ABT6W629_9ACTN|nr:hypothetical protein [Streptantibioticus silvisoli]MDI5966210.1 hypothetical protein [Streptantibioticus silvisoli]
MTRSTQAAVRAVGGGTGELAVEVPGAPGEALAEPGGLDAAGGGPEGDGDACPPPEPPQAVTRISAPAGSTASRSLRFGVRRVRRDRPVRRV